MVRVSPVETRIITTTGVDIIVTELWVVIGHMVDTIESVTTDISRSTADATINSILKQLWIL